MTADYRRMIWQNRANKVAVALMWALMIAEVDEVYRVLKYHFPFWDDVRTMVFPAMWMMARFFERHTRQYRF